MTVISLLLVLVTGVLLGGALGALWGRSRAADSVATSIAETERIAIESRASDQAIVREGLERLQDQMRDLDQHRVSWQSQLKQQVDEVRYSTDTLRRETSALSTALRKPQVRGRWVSSTCARWSRWPGWSRDVTSPSRCRCAATTG